MKFKKVFACILSASLMMSVLSTLSMPVYADSVGTSWSISVEETAVELPADVQTAFDEAMEDYNGNKLVPLAYYGLQVVAGFNYALICREVSNDSKNSLKWVEIYNPNAPGMNTYGKAKIGYIKDLNIEDYAYTNEYYLPEEPVCGGMEMADDITCCELPSDAQKAFDTRFLYIDGTWCSPVAYLGKQQTDDGTDYAMMCTINAVVPEPDVFLEIMILHQRTDGSVYIKSEYTVLAKRTYHQEYALENTSKISTDNIVLGNTFTVMGISFGGKGNHCYAVLYKKKSDKKWTVKQNYSSDNYVVIKPAKATDYDVCVKVKDDNGDIVKKFFTVKVNPKLANNSTISATTIKKGNTVTLKGSATGGMGNYQYAVLYKKKSESKWTVRQGYKENDEVIVRPYMATGYDICIKVKDETGTISKKYFSVTVK